MNRNQYADSIAAKANDEREIAIAAGPATMPASSVGDELEAIAITALVAAYTWRWASMSGKDARDVMQKIKHRVWRAEAVLDLLTGD